MNVAGAAERLETRYGTQSATPQGDCKALLLTGMRFDSSLVANGLVVQLVRISACHAEGREFESRPDRQ